MTFRYLNFLLLTFSFILLSVCLIQNEDGHLAVSDVSQNATYLASFYVTKKYPLPLTIDRYKDGCHLKHILGGGVGGRQVCLSLCLSVCLSLSLILTHVCV